MKKLYIFLIVVVVVIVVCFSWVKGTYNNLVTMDEGVKTMWSNVENQYQRRIDLIPNLVNTVKGYAEHEKETLSAVVNARAKATQTQLNVENLDAASIDKLNSVQGELSSALSRLMVVAEKYPDLKANQNFKDLQVQLEGTENRIAVERRNFNESAKAYNILIRQFPSNIFASIFGFEKKSYFEAAKGAEQAPTVKF